MDEPLERTEELDARYNATPAATATNATHFFFCLSLLTRKYIVPSQQYLDTNECFLKFSKYLTWLFRFGGNVLHQQSLSLTLHELFHFGLFTKHINTCRTFMEADPHHIFGNPYTADVYNECKRCNINVDSMRWFIPFATVVWHNTKGRIAFTVMNTDLVRQPIASDWCATDMSVDDILRKLKDRDSGPNGGYKVTNAFFRVQSGHGNLREEQRPGVPYDFRHNILIHKKKFQIGTRCREIPKTDICDVKGVIFTLFQFNFCLPNLTCFDSLAAVFCCSTPTINEHERHCQQPVKQTTAIFWCQTISI